ncbi:MAG TPA: response regulator [Candidatus Omnitrophota bacterium]|nr:response regulator [Candidatus Omnitrophota bacterium]
MAGSKILICDDEVAVVEILETRLKSLGYEVCKAYDGEEALAKLKSEKPNLIITDVLMPKLTGYEFMKKIRADKDTKDIPTIVVSAKNSMRDFFAAVNNVHFMSKPYDPKVLMDTIEKLLAAGGGVQSKNVILGGVEEQLIAKVKELLTSFGLNVFKALNEDDAYNLAKTLRPKFILLQFWEDLSVMDPAKLAVRLSQDSKLAVLPFYVFCKGSVALDAMKTFKGDRMIGYSQSSDLLKKLEELFKENVTA